MRRLSQIEKSIQMFKERFRSLRKKNEPPIDYMLESKIQQNEYLLEVCSKLTGMVNEKVTNPGLSKGYKEGYRNAGRDVQFLLMQCMHLQTKGLKKNNK